MDDNATKPAVLLLADISGYTNFVRLHSMATSHANEIISRLLGEIIRMTRPPFQVAELEGDAVFFYALNPPQPESELGPLVAQQVTRFFQAFDQQIRTLQSIPSCPCEACRRLGDLQLKQVVHRGHVSIQSVASFQKPFGLDVILVHRLMKNSIPERRYLLLTEPAFKTSVGSIHNEPPTHVEEVDGIGPVSGRLLAGRDLEAFIAGNAGTREPDRAAWIPAALWKVAMQVRTFLRGYRRQAPPSAPLSCK